MICKEPVKDYWKLKKFCNFNFYICNKINIEKRKEQKKAGFKRSINTLFHIKIKQA